MYICVCVYIYAIDYARQEGHYLEFHCDDRYIIHICICKYICVCVCVYAIDKAKGEGHYLGSHCDDRCYIYSI